MLTPTRRLDRAVGALPLTPFAAVAGALLAIATIYLGLAAPTIVLGIGALFAYGMLRWPAALAYFVLAWLVFEKAFEPHIHVNPNTVNQVGDYLLIVTLLWSVLLNLLRHRTPFFTMYPLGLPLVFFCIVSVVSAIINAVPFNIAELGLLSTTHTMFIFLALVNLAVSKRAIYRFVDISIAAMAVISFIGLLQILPSSPAWKLAADPPYYTYGGITRIMGVFEHPNSLGDDLAIVMPLCLMYLYVGRLEGRRRLWMTIAAIVMLVAFVLTGSREAWGAVLASMVVIGLTVERGLLHVLVARVLPLLVVVGVTFAPIVYRVQQTKEGNQRFELLRISLPIIRSHLWFGVGPGRYGGHVAATTNSPLYTQYDLKDYFYGSGGQLDMFWTHLLAEAGILGVAAFLACIVACVLVGRRAYLRARDPRERAVLLGLLFAAPVTVFISLLSSALETGPRATLFWALMGLLVVLSVHVARESQYREAAGG